MVLSGLVCGVCAAPAVMAIAPGHDPAIERAEADRAWCQTCWRRRFKTERKRR
jgi:hypothetical protein